MPFLPRMRAIIYTAGSIKTFLSFSENSALLQSCPCWPRLTQQALIFYRLVPNLSSPYVCLKCGSTCHRLLAQLSLEERNINFRLYHKPTCQLGLYSFIYSILLSTNGQISMEDMSEAVRAQFLTFAELAV